MDQATLQQRAQALQVRFTNFEKRAQQRNEELQATQAKEVQEMERALQPVLTQLFQQNRCSILLEREQAGVAAVNPAMDFSATGRRRPRRARPDADVRPRPPRHPGERAASRRALIAALGKQPGASHVAARPEVLRRARAGQPGRTGRTDRRDARRCGSRSGDRGGRRALARRRRLGRLLQRSQAGRCGGRHRRRRLLRRGKGQGAIAPRPASRSSRPRRRRPGRPPLDGCTRANASIPPIRRGIQACSSRTTSGSVTAW